MKSAYEIAMARSGGQSTPKLNDEQKAALADISNLYQSKVAERETFLRSKIGAARATGDEAEAAQLEEQLTRDLQALRTEMESKKDKIWSGAGAL